MLVILVLGLFGCKNFETQKLSSEEVLNQKMEYFEWKEVDVYPSFVSCKNLIEKSALKKCFESTLARHIRQSFSRHRVIVGDSINGSVRLYLVISKKGIPKVDSMNIPALLQQQLPKLQNWLLASVDSLPKIYPAQTRGIPVSVKFTLPVKIVSE